MRSDVRDGTKIGRYWAPLLNGEPVHDCVVADEEAGYVEVYQVNDRGHLLPDLPLARLNGIVKLVPFDKWSEIEKRVGHRARVLAGE